MSRSASRRSPPADPADPSLARLHAGLAESDRRAARVRRLEEELRELRERYTSLVERAACGIMRGHPGHHLFEANPALVRMLGYDSVEELLQVSLPEGLFFDLAEREHLVKELASRGFTDWKTIRLRRKDGAPLVARISVRAVRGPDGRFDHNEAIVEDLTEQLQREELLLRRERMASLGTTLAGAAHELNNPLAAIIGFAQLLLTRELDDEARSALDTIDREATRAARVVKDLLLLARPNSSGEREPRDLNEIVRYILATRAYPQQARQIVCLTELAPDAPIVAGERSQLEQVVLNLVVNAEQAIAERLDVPCPPRDDAMPERGRILVRTETTPEHVILTVEDNGRGIPAEQLARIWDAFWTTKTEGEGTGLGLSVVRDLVAGHGGTIDAESHVGAGSRFRVRLPRVTPAEERGAARVASRALDILVVDDEPSIRAFIERYLHSRGHAVIVAEDGHRALEIARRMCFDVVICDLRMPGLDGAEVVRRLRALPGGDRPRYLIATAEAEHGARASRVEQLRADAVLRKPFDIEQLRRSVEDG